MFCLRCGTEMPRLARECPACGTPVSGPGNLPDEPASVAPAVVAPREPAVDSPPIPSSVEAGPSIGAGGLDTPGPPRDPLGRVVLVTAVVLAADQLLPWVVVNNNATMAMAAFGLPAVLLVVLLGLAVVPVVVPALRVHPSWSAVPFAVGGACLGATLTVWLLLSPLANFAIGGNALSLSQGISSVPTIAVSPHWGLYLFALGSVVLLVAGHRLLLAAREAVDAPATALSQSQSPQPQAQPAHAALEAAAAAESPAGVAADVADVVPSAAGEAMPGLSASVPLPGTASWNEAPSVPAPLHQGPWRSQTIPLRGR
jgi:hypothetical protein